MDFKPLFKPKTLAVIGVSLTNDRHPANVIYNKNNLRHQAKVYPVNNRGGVFQGETVYTHISEIPQKIDLAAIATRAELVPSIVMDCIQAGVGGAVVISGGFAETGQKDLQDRLKSIAKEADFPFIGPNCLGIYSPPYVDTFSIPSERIVRPDKGKVALVSQSGGILVDHMVKFAEEGVGLSVAVSIGNKALIRELELLRYFASDPETDVIADPRDEGYHFIFEKKRLGLGARGKASLLPGRSECSSIHLGHQSRGGHSVCRRGRLSCGGQGGFT